MYPSWENEEILYSSNYCQGTRFKVESKEKNKNWMKNEYVQLEHTYRRISHGCKSNEQLRLQA